MNFSVFLTFFPILWCLVLMFPLSAPYFCICSGVVGWTASIGRKQDKKVSLPLIRCLVNPSRTISYPRYLHPYLHLIRFNSLLSQFNRFVTNQSLKKVKFFNPRILIRTKTAFGSFDPELGAFR